MIKKSILGLFILFFSVSFCYGNVSVGPLSFGSLGVNPNQSSSTAGIVSDSNYNFTDGIFTYTEQGERVFNLWWYSGSLKYTTAGASYLPSGNGTINGYFLCQVGYHVSMPEDPRQSSICVFHNGFSDMGTYTDGLNAYSVNCAYGTCLLKMYKSGYYYNSEEISSYAVLIGQYSGYQTVLSNDFLSLSDIQYSDSPVGGSSVGGSSVYGQCTWNDIKIILESEGYNKYLCYGGLDNFDLYDSSLNYNPIPGSGKSIGDIWAWSGSRAWDNFQQWFTFWWGLYIDDSNNYDSMWESYPAVYHTYFQLFDTYKGSVEPRTVLEYCNLLNFDSSVMNNNAGGYFEPTCETVIREKQTGLWESRLDGTIYSGGIYTGNVPISVNWSGVGNMSGSNVQDSMNFLQNFFNLAKSKINTNYGGGLGALPSYIIVFLLAIILFRFLSH